MSLAAKQEGVAARMLFRSHRLERQGRLMAVSVGRAVVPASELAAACAEIAKLQRVLGKKMPENEIPRAVFDVLPEWAAAGANQRVENLIRITWHRALAEAMRRRVFMDRQIVRVGGDPTKAHHVAHQGLAPVSRA